MYRSGIRRKYCSTLCFKTALCMEISAC